MEAPFSRNPAALAYGAVVGAWRVVGWGGQGSYGVVYCVQRVDDPEAGMFALKMALLSDDERLLREVELLACMDHPHVPRLHDSGWWKPADGLSFPFLVMDWVAGAHLYEWAEQHRTSFRQGMRVLAQVLRALESLHAMGGVHRDVKGSNVLVTGEGRAVLTDFGLGRYRGASALTRQAEPVGTPQYLSPQALLHRERYWRRAQPRYEASSADDVYAVGVTAWFLVTGTYLPPGSSPKEGEDGALGAYGGRVSAHDLQGVPPEFAMIIRRMLSDDPAARGRAGEVAQALEEAAEKAGREADRPIPHDTVDDVAVSLAQQASRRPALGWGLGLAGAAVGLMIALSTWKLAPRRSVKPDAGPTSMAETVLAMRVNSELPGPALQGIHLNLPKRPLPGQRQPPCSNNETEINGGCWLFQVNIEPPCGPRIYEWKKGCYVPTFDPPRPPTSDQP